MKVSDPRAQAAQQEEPPKVDLPLKGLRILSRIDRKTRLLLLERQTTAARRRHTMLAWSKRLMPWMKRLATLAIMLVAIVMALVTWSYYVTAPWTRDGNVRVQVA